MDQTILTGLFAAGILAGVFSRRLPMSGGAALALSLLPAAGIGMAMVFC